MKSPPRSFPPLPRLGLAAFAALAWFTPLATVAQAMVFRTILSGKDATATRMSGSGGFYLTYAQSSTASGVVGVARFTGAPVALSAVGALSRRPHQKRPQDRSGRGFASAAPSRPIAPNSPATKRFDFSNASAHASA